jgi:hypothetical protein
MSKLSPVILHQNSERHFTTRRRLGDSHHNAGRHIDKSFNLGIRLATLTETFPDSAFVKSVLIATDVGKYHLELFRNNPASTVIFTLDQAG